MVAFAGPGPRPLSHVQVLCMRRGRVCALSIDDGEFAARFLMAVELSIQHRFRDTGVECSPIKRH